MEIEVAAKPVKVEVGFEKVDATSVRLHAAVSGAEGVDYRIQYALCEKNERPSSVLALAVEDEQVQGNPLNAWTDDPLFSGLTPGATYYAFARVLGISGVDEEESTGSSQLVVEDADGGDADSEQGNGSGGSGSGGGSDNGPDNGSGDLDNGSGNGSESGDDNDGGSSDGSNSGSDNGSGDGSNGGADGGAEDGSGEDSGDDEDAPGIDGSDAPEDEGSGQESPDTGAGDSQEEDQEGPDDGDRPGGGQAGEAAEDEDAGSTSEELESATHPDLGAAHSALPTTGDVAPVSLVALLTVGVASIIAGAALRLRQHGGASKR